MENKIVIEVLMHTLSPRDLKEDCVMVFAMT